jgi:C4-dicarboxylate transporter DctQ subunit
MIRRLLERAATELVIFGFLLLTGLGFLNVCLRYVSGGVYALYWAEEVIRYGFIWMVWLIAPVAFRRGALLGVDLLTQKLSPRARTGVTATGNALVIALLGGYVWYGIVMVRLNWTQLSAALEFPMGWAYLALPVGAAVLLLEIAMTTVRLLGGGQEGGDGSAA